MYGLVFVCVCERERERLYHNRYFVFRWRSWKAITSGVIYLTDKFKVICLQLSLSILCICLSTVHPPCEGRKIAPSCLWVYLCVCVCVCDDSYLVRTKIICRPKGNKSPGDGGDGGQRCSRRRQEFMFSSCTPDTCWRACAALLPSGSQGWVSYNDKHTHKHTHQKHIMPSHSTHSALIHSVILCLMIILVSAVDKEITKHIIIEAKWHAINFTPQPHIQYIYNIFNVN